MSTEKEDMVANWIKENGNPEIERLTQTNKETANKVASLLSQNGMDANTLAQLVDTQIAEVNKWLNGKHNFSEKILAQITATLERKY